jgi:hypothetical protein
LRALLLLAALERTGFDSIWYARDALGVIRPMDRLMEAQLSGERCAWS